MKNFTFKILILAGSLFIVGVLQAQVPNEAIWNVSTAEFNALGTMTANTTVNGLTIYASASATVVVDANTKSLDGMDFTHRLKLGGTGSFDQDGKPVTRVLSFQVNGNSKITVIGMSSSSSENRELVVAAGNKSTELGRFQALGSPISKGEFTYTGGPTTIYLYSVSSGINIYYLKKEAASTNVDPIPAHKIAVFPNPASQKIYVDVQEPTLVGIYSLTGSLMLQKNVESLSDYVDVSRMAPGLYLIKSVNNSSLNQKIAIK